MKYLVNIDLNKNQLIQARVENLAAFPGTPVLGQIFYHTGDATIYQYDGVGPSGGGGWTSLAAGFTNLAYTSSATNGVVTSDTGTNATILAATGTIAGLMLPADFTKLGTIASGAQVNVDTNLGIANIGANTLDITSSTGTNVTVPAATTTLAGLLTATKFNEIEANTAKVSYPGPQTVTLTGDVTGTGTTSIATTIGAGVIDWGMLNQSWVITQAESIATNDNDTSIPTSAAVKDYVNTSITGALIYQGGYNATTDVPSIDDGTPIAGIKQGHTYTVTAAGNFFTEAVQIGDMIIAEIDSPTTLANWTVVNKNIPDIVDASETAKGIVELATVAEATAGVDTVRAVTPVGLSAAITATKYAANIGDGVSTSITISAATHGLGTSGDFIAQVREVSTGDLVITDTNFNSTTGLVTFTFNVAPTTNQFRVVIKS